MHVSQRPTTTTITTTSTITTTTTTPSTLHLPSMLQRTRSQCTSSGSGSSSTTAATSTSASSQIPAMSNTPAEEAIVGQYLDRQEGYQTVKIAVIGQQRVGKRSLLCRFCFGHFLTVYDPAYDGVGEKWVTVQKHPVRVRWEMPVEDPDDDPVRARGVADECEACLLVYDVCSRESFQRLPGLFEDLFSAERRGQTTIRKQPKVPPKSNGNSNGISNGVSNGASIDIGVGVGGAKGTGIPFFVVASRTDRPRTEWEVSLLEGDQFSAQIGAAFLQTSAKTGAGAGEDVVRAVATRVLHSRTLARR